MTLRTNYGLRFYSQLNMMVESILVNMYSPHRPEARSTSFILSMDERLSEWWKDLPSGMKLDPANLPEYCPPISITVLKYAHPAPHV